MQRVLKILLVPFLFFITFTAVYADDITCEYPDLGLTMTWNTDKAFNTESNPHVKMAGFETGQEPERFLLWRSGKQVNLTEKAEIDQNLYKEVLNTYGCNDGMYVCVYSEIALDEAILGTVGGALESLFTWDIDNLDNGGYKEKLIIMSADEFRESDYSWYEGGRWGALGWDQVQIKWRDGYDFGDILGSAWDFIEGLFGVDDNHLLYYKETICDIAHYDGPYIGVNINCSVLQSDLLRYYSQITEYSQCDPSEVSCKIKTATELNKTEQSIKDQCRLLLQNLNYAGGEAPCIDACLKIKDTLNDYKKGTDLWDNGTSTSTCGFSSRLFVWINNIMKWIKYILPVLVIVLGILDFIKAIVANKEDDMKKAQNNFVKRLIAAALAFLVPLIISFILEKMGFTPEACGMDVLK